MTSDAQKLRSAAAVMADQFPGLDFFPGVLADKADLLEHGHAYAQDAARGRIILGWLAEHGVRLATLNGRAFASSINEAALRDGIGGLVSAGPEWTADPAEVLGEEEALLSASDLVATVDLLQAVHGQPVTDRASAEAAAEAGWLLIKYRRLLAVALGKD